MQPVLRSGSRKQYIGIRLQISGHLSNVSLSYYALNSQTQGKLRGKSILHTWFARIGIGRHLLKVTCTDLDSNENAHGPKSQIKAPSTIRIGALVKQAIRVVAFSTPMAIRNNGIPLALTHTPEHHLDVVNAKWMHQQMSIYWSLTHYKPYTSPLWKISILSFRTSDLFNRCCVQSVTNWAWVTWDQGNLRGEPRKVFIMRRTKSTIWIFRQHLKAIPSWLFMNQIVFIFNSWSSERTHCRFWCFFRKRTHLTIYHAQWTCSLIPSDRHRRPEVRIFVKEIPRQRCQKSISKLAVTSAGHLPQVQCDEWNVPAFLQLACCLGRRETRSVHCASCPTSSTHRDWSINSLIVHSLTRWIVLRRIPETVSNETMEDQMEENIQREQGSRRQLGIDSGSKWDKSSTDRWAREWRGKTTNQYCFWTLNLLLVNGRSVPPAVKHSRQEP